MKDNTEIKNGVTTERKVSDKELENVTGGAFVVSTNAWSSSGDTPKYKVGDTVKIKYLFHELGETAYCEAVVTSVSADKYLGLIFTEYGYSVKITSAPREVRMDTVNNPVGKVIDDVMESALSQ